MGLETGRSPPFAAVVKNARRYTSTAARMHLHDVFLSIGKLHIFTLTFSFTCCFVWVWNLVSHLYRKPWSIAECEQGAEHSCTYGALIKSRQKEAAQTWFIKGKLRLNTSTVLSHNFVNIWVTWMVVREFSGQGWRTVTEFKRRSCQKLLAQILEMTEEWVGLNRGRYENKCGLPRYETWIH
jgi:hypothetical protein